MASCPDGCANYKPGTAEDWFKIAEDGFSHMGSYTDEDGKEITVPRFATDIMALEKNNTWTVTIPEDLKPGQYLLRHELCKFPTRYIILNRQVPPETEATM